MMKFMTTLFKSKNFQLMHHVIFVMKNKILIPNMLPSKKIVAFIFIALLDKFCHVD